MISRIPTRLLIEASAQHLREDKDEVILRNCFGARDPFVESMLNLLARELSLPEHPVQPLVAEHLSCALAAHLVHRFNANVGHLASSSDALHPSALSRVLDFIHGSPDADIALTDLACIAQVSRFHFSRLFKRSTGTSPMAYLERVRMLRARKLLTETRTAIASVAAMTGFTDQSQFARRFKLYFGYSPSDYVKQIIRGGRQADHREWYPGRLKGTNLPVRAIRS
ncbi:AraC family transcriptional regulator [Pseudoxanthomonas sp. SL93]|uniref:helix-turn-helix domain-containing protein n=1 Tax=Pseudoxanthomonas sp. SL93 TaxID=2995142 RepID=UPI00226FA044|nr:AraC family transcriptional regulator [Pseudoxanthomonas sp. SL93]WAC64034.1 AraC family transcriptional regulator [Pseudoxanthomonas sp. SL93]